MFQFAVRVRDLPVAAGATRTRRLRQAAIAEPRDFTRHALVVPMDRVPRISR